MKKLKTIGKVVDGKFQKVGDGLSTLGNKMNSICNTMYSEARKLKQMARECNDSESAGIIDNHINDVIMELNDAQDILKKIYK